MWELIEDPEAILGAMIAERRKAGRYLAAVTVLLLLSAGTLTLANLVHQRVAEDAIAFRAAVDEQGRAAAKARHPASRGSSRSGGNRPAARLVPQPAEPAEEAGA